MKNKLSVLGTFLVLGSVIMIFYNIIKKERFILISNQIVHNIYTENEKVHGEFKYGETNLNIIYLYIEISGNEHRFYVYDNTGNTSKSEFFEQIISKIPIKSNISIWVDKDEINEYKDVEIQKLQIGNSIVIDNSTDYLLYNVLAIIIGGLFLFISKKYD